MQSAAAANANPGMTMSANAGAHGPNLGVEGGFPSLSGAVEWLNSPPLTAEGLKGKVVLIDFWTYSCINCLRSIPYVKAWAEKYKDHGLVVIGVHTPEFAFERKVEQCAGGGIRPENRLSRRHRQRLRDLARLRQ